MSGELLVILVVAIIVFPPKKIPELAHILTQIWRAGASLKEQAWIFFQVEIQKQQLVDNQHKAEKADKLYQENPDS